MIANSHRRYDGTKPQPAEHEYRVYAVRRWLPAGPISAGGYRKHDLIQFVERNGRPRTVAVRDIIEIR